MGIDWGGILKKMKSSTHFRMGPMPLAHRMSMSASLKSLNRPPAVVHPKELQSLHTLCFSIDCLSNMNIFAIEIY